MTRGERVFKHRRGMSPLIATVLLMAFAVALGGMIMNWSLGVSVSGECEKIKVTVTQFCTQDNTLLLSMKSDPESVALQGVRLLINTGSIEQSINVRQSELPTGAPLSLKIPFAVPADARIDLIGIVGPTAEPYACESVPIQRIESITPCG